MSEGDFRVPRGSKYALVPANGIDDERLVDFASRVWRDQPPYERILSSWWRRASPDCANALVHDPSATVVGLCAGRPSQWIVAGHQCPAISICDFFIDPRHGGKLLGRRLLRSFEAPGQLINAISISEVGAAYVKRMGWMGPYASTLMVLPLPRVAKLVHSLVARRVGFVLKDYEAWGSQIPGTLKGQLDHIEATRAPQAWSRMVRGASEWSWRLSICPDRTYRFCVAERNGEPIGYVVTRRMESGRSRRMGRLKGAIIVDLVAAHDDPAALRALAASAVATATELGAVVALFLTTALAHRRALTAIGFISPEFPVLGGLLRRRAPIIMWPPRGPGAALKADTMTMTFADSTMDFDL